MKQRLTALTLAAATGLSMLGAPQGAVAGPIENACLGSGRATGAVLCACIQRAADGTLTRREQRAAARFFSDPGRAQDVRMSTREKDNAFWARYRQFGATAEAQCRRG